MIQTWSTEQSSRISDMEYDTELKELTITFKRGGKYKYSNVDAGVYTSLVTAESVGKAFNEIIWVNSDKYSYERVG